MYPLCHTPTVTARAHPWGHKSLGKVKGSWVFKRLSPENTAELFLSESGPLSPAVASLFPVTTSYTLPVPSAPHTCQTTGNTQVFALKIMHHPGASNTGSPYTPPLHGLAGLARNGSQGLQQRQSHPNPALRALESEWELGAFAPAPELSRDIREASVPLHPLCASNPPGTAHATSLPLLLLNLGG